MSDHRVTPPPPQAPGPASPRLGYLLKLALLGFAELVNAEVAGLGIDTREWSTLITLDDDRPLSQREVAQRVGVDRTTMVTLVDELQAKGLVQRRPHEDDRRKNVIVLTPAGRDIRQHATRHVDDAERRFLAGLSEADAQQLKSALQMLIAPTP